MCDRLSHRQAQPHTTERERKPVKGLLVMLLVFALIVAMLVLAASLTPMQIPGEPVWFDAVFV